MSVEFLALKRILPLLALGMFLASIGCSKDEKKSAVEKNIVPPEPNFYSESDYYLSNLCEGASYVGLIKINSDGLFEVENIINSKSIDFISKFHSTTRLDLKQGDQYFLFLYEDDLKQFEYSSGGSAVYFNSHILRVIEYDGKQYVPSGKLTLFNDALNFIRRRGLEEADKEMQKGKAEMDKE